MFWQIGIVAPRRAAGPCGFSFLALLLDGRKYMSPCEMHVILSVQITEQEWAEANRQLPCAAMVARLLWFSFGATGFW